MTKVLLGLLVAAMLTLTGIVTYSHFAPAAAEGSADGTQPSGCQKCSTCCTHELPAAGCSESAGCADCPTKTKTAPVEEPKVEVKDDQ